MWRANKRNSTENQALLRMLKRSEYKKVINFLSGFVTIYPFISCITLNTVGDQYMFVEFIIEKKAGHEVGNDILVSDE